MTAKRKRCECAENAQEPDVAQAVITEKRGTRAARNETQT